MVLQALDYEVINLSWNQYMKYFRVRDECFGLYLFAGNAQIYPQYFIVTDNSYFKKEVINLVFFSLIHVLKRYNFAMLKYVHTYSLFLTMVLIPLLDYKTFN